MLIINFEGREAKGLSKGRYDETFAGEDGSNMDIKDPWAHQILQRAHKNFKWPIKIWKFACI